MNRKPVKSYTPPRLLLIASLGLTSWTTSCETLSTAASRRSTSEATGERYSRTWYSPS